jgi:hypothetical protein
MSVWMLLEPKEQLLAELFRHVDHPDFVPLFDSTELAIYAAFSPLLVADDSAQTLSRLVRQAPTDWPGLLIESEHSRDALLAHLRHLLIVRFEQTRRGMLHYWNPKVAGPLFFACTHENLADWLGPISRLQWHSTSDTNWQALDNPTAASWLATATKPLLSISLEQSQALEQTLPPLMPNGQES